MQFLNDVFYLPHNIDFRGRAYPLPPHLNHMGDDLSRGLMKFAEARPLGQAGLRWLKIHLANLYGFDKASFDDRVRFVEDRLKEIFDSAEKPLEGKRWWIEADDPWQCLGACIELRNALTSPDPEAYESDLPVHQDGTCNGLQHYAALGGDVIGAKQVNLDIGDRPSDVYTFVANGIEKIIEKDCEKGVEIAKLLKGKISRKVVKQTVRHYPLFRNNISELIPIIEGHDNRLRSNVHWRTGSSFKTVERSRRYTLRELVGSFHVSCTKCKDKTAIFRCKLLI